MLKLSYMKKKIILISPDLFLHENIAIIGSSGSLKSGKYAKKIDDYQEVVRFNRAPTKGFENMVGSKRTLTVANAHVFSNVQLRKKSGWKQKEVSFIRDLRNTSVLLFAPKGSNWKNKDKNVHSSVNPYAVDYKAMKTLVGVPGRQPTAGFGFINLCVKSGLKPHLFGFDVEPRRRDHYWEERDNDTSWHSVGYEKEVLKKMHKKGMIVLHS